MNSFSHVPPGFRFHPTDEELVDYYLRKKVTSRRIDLDVIKDVDLYKIEPWDLQELCRIGTEEQNEWYFFSHKDKKYPTGTRTNRATAAGFWKATGRDKAIYSKQDLIGMRKTLVFYKGRAPNGQKSDWIMHEYRLETDPNGTPQEEGWVVCRVFKKRMATMRKDSEHESPIWYREEQASFMQDMDSPKQHSSLTYNYPPYPCKKELDLQYQLPPPPPHNHHHQPFLQLPFLETPKPLQSASPMTSFAHHHLHNINHPNTPLQSSPLNEQENMLHQINHRHDQNQLQSIYTNPSNSDHGVTDWRVLDKFVASQLSQEEVSKVQNNGYANVADDYRAPHREGTDLMVARNLDKQEIAPESAFTGSSSCQIDRWK